MERGLLCLVLLAGPAPLALFAARSARNGTGEPAPALRMLIALVVYLSLQASVGVLLGALWLLGLPALVAAELALAGAGAALLGFASPSAERDRGRDTPSPAYDAATPLIAAAAAGSLAVLAGLVITRPVTDYDSLLYHLPTMANWVQHGGLLPYEQFRLEQIGVYPYTWEVVCSLFFLPLRDDTLVTLPNLAAWAAFGLASYRLGLEIGARPPAAAAFSLALLQTPLVLDQVNTLHVDLAMAAFFLAGLAFVGRFWRSGFPEHLALAGCTVGLLAGIKMSGLAYAALLLGLLFLSFVQRGLRASAAASPPAAARATVVLALLALSSVALAGSYWYLSNLLTYGNPLGFLEVVLGDRVILPGTLTAEDVRQTTLAQLFDPASRTHLRILYEALFRELGPFFPLMATTLASLPFVWGRRAGSDRRMLAGAGLLAAITLLLYWSTPYGADTPNGMNGGRITAWIGQGFRYALPALGLLTVIAARCASAFSLPSLVYGALAAIAVAGLAAEIPALFAVGFCVASAVAIAPVRRLLGSPRPGARLGRAVLAGAALASILLLGSAGRTVRDREWAAHHGRIVSDIARLPADAVVGYVLSDRSYPLFGRNLERSVVFVPLEGSSAPQYAEHVRRSGAAVLAVGPLVGGYAKRAEARWFTDPDPPFERISGGDLERETVLFRVAGRAPAAAP